MTDETEHTRLRFSANAWHRRVATYVTGKSFQRTTLCPYFWTVVLCCILLPFVVIGKAVSRTVNVMIVKRRAYRAEHPKVVREPRWHWPVINPVIPAIGAVAFLFLMVGLCIYLLVGAFGAVVVFEGIGVAALGVGAVVGVIVLVIYVLKNRPEKEFSYEEWQERMVRSGAEEARRAAKKERGPNVMIAYLKARKERMCPYVEWEEGAKT